MKRKIYSGGICGLTLAAALALGGCGSTGQAETTAAGSAAETEAAGENTAGEAAEETKSEAEGAETDDFEHAEASGDTAAGAAETDTVFEEAAAVLRDTKTTQYFTDEAVPDEDTEKILQAGINTTSAMNGQPWHFTAVTDQELLAEIGDAMSQAMSANMPAGAKPADPGAAGAPGGESNPSPQTGTPGGEAENPPQAGQAGGGSGPEGAAPSDAAGEKSAAAADEARAESAGTESAGTESAGAEEKAEEESSAAAVTEAAAESAPAAGQAAAPAKTMTAKAGIADAPLAIVISAKEGSELDAGLACQSMFLEAKLLGYGAKIVSSPTMVLNGENQAEYKEKLGIPDDQTVQTVLLIGKEDTSVDLSSDGVTGASIRNEFAEMVTYVKETE